LDGVREAPDSLGGVKSFKRISSRRVVLPAGLLPVAFLLPGALALAQSSPEAESSPSGATSEAAPQPGRSEASEAPGEDWSDPISTDRPGNGNAATTVPWRRLQLELGGLYAWTDADSPVSQVIFPLGIRYGLLPQLELRLLSGIIGIQSVDGDTAVDATDTALGVKVGLTEQSGFRPDLAVMADVYLPTGSGAFGAEVVVPELRAAASWGLPAGFGAFANVGFDVPDDGIDRYARLLYLGQINYTLPAGADRVGIFGELFGRTSFDDRPDFLLLDVGVAWQLSPDLQLDVFSQHRLAGSAPDFQLSLGISVRL